ncbi:MAG: DEAD/DEAH box helicase family protein [Neglectibacter timonensis]
MRYEPHEYQKYAVDYIETHPAATIFLDCGLGKTSITLTAIADLLFDSFEIHKVLVIAPLRVARDTWTAEADKWDSRTSCSDFIGTSPARAALINADICSSAGSVNGSLIELPLTSI